MIKPIRILCLILSVIFIARPVFAESKMISADSFSQIQKIVAQVKDPRHLLVALDDDDTLTMTPCYPYSVGSTPKTGCQYLGSPSWFEWQSKLPKNNPSRIWNSFSELISDNNLIFNMSKMSLDDPTIPAFLRFISDHHAHIVIATARGYSMLGATEAQFGQDDILNVIERAAIKTPTGHISFPGYYFPTPWKHNHVRRIAYLHGILYLSGQNKGVMLQQFLAKTNQTKNIKTIIFVDDTLQNVLDVAAAFSKDPNVNVISIHYLRLAKQKAEFLTGKNAKKLQATTNVKWNNLKTAMQNNLAGPRF